MSRRTPERPPLSPAVRETFNHWKRGDLFDSLEASYRQLLDRRKNVVEVAEQHEPGKHTASNCLLLQQALLHRAERLIAACGSMLLENNVYGLALIVRGHYETTGVLGYLCNRLDSLEEGKLKFEGFAYNAACAVLGSKHSQFTKTPNPPNILTCIDKADSHLDAHYLNEKKGMLRDGYDWLSEFAHPNFCSNCAAFTIDKLNRRFVLQHDSEIQDRDFDLIAHLVISARLFIWLFDDSTHRLTKNLLSR